MRNFMLVAGLVLLFATEALRVYLIMPFPGSQQSDSIHWAYWIHTNLQWLRLAGFLLIAWPVIQIFSRGGKWSKIRIALALLVYLFVFGLFHFKMMADKMFLQPSSLQFSERAAHDSLLGRLVLGVHVDGVSKAYPVQYIGYHHQVRDSVGRLAVMVTYCTVCRSGRVYEPVVKGQVEQFRLVGMDHFNAMFEDARTGSWWQQATGEAVAGPLKGTKLREIPAEQMTLGAWLDLYPDSRVMLPDTSFLKQYQAMAAYDRGTSKSSLVKRDSVSWNPKSWVIGVKYDTIRKSYDWNELMKRQVIQDSLGSLPILLVAGGDSMSFFVRSRIVGGRTLYFQQEPGSNNLQDLETGSTWTRDGRCIEGGLMGEKLKTVQAYQEFWHSWDHFQQGGSILPAR